MTDRDDELRERLRAADPAAALPPTDPDRVARLLESTMSHDVTDESRETGTHDRSPLTWVVAAAAAAVIAVAGGFLFLNGDDGAQEVAPTPDDTSVTQLQAPAPNGARCMVPTAAVLSNAEVAFDGEVQEISEGMVTLAPTRWYAGEETDLVTVTAPDRDLAQLLVSVEFEEGGRYLVAANDGQVMICGFSAEHDDELAALYAEAFGG